MAARKRIALRKSAQRAAAVDRTSWEGIAALFEIVQHHQAVFRLVFVLQGVHILATIVLAVLVLWTPVLSHLVEP